MHRSARAAGAAAPVLLVGLLAGCAGLPATPVQAAAPARPPQGGVELVVGVHANGPAPALPKRALLAVETAVANEASVGVIAVDGRPQVLQDAVPVSVTGAAGGDRTAADRRSRDSIVELVEGAAARTAGSDLFSGLLAAAKAAKRASTPVDRIVAIDSGLNDRGSLDLTAPGATEATPAEIAARLRRTGELRGDAFAGLTVDFIGLGTAVAAPQRALPEKQVTGIRAIYSAVVRAGGGTPVVHDDAVGTGRPASALPVAAVAPTSGSIALGGSTVLGDGTSIAFRPGTAVFRDQRAATDLLRPLARWLQRGSGHRASVVGRTSSEGAASKAEDLALSSARAAAVKTLLVRLGAEPALVTARGEGYVADPPDRVAGVLDPAKAALNRVVRITTVA